MVHSRPHCYACLTGRRQGPFYCGTRRVRVGKLPCVNLMERPTSCEFSKKNKITITLFNFFNIYFCHNPQMLLFSALLKSLKSLPHSLSLTFFFFHFHFLLHCCQPLPILPTIDHKTQRTCLTWESNKETNKWTAYMREKQNKILFNGREENIWYNSYISKCSDLLITYINIYVRWSFNV